MSEMLANPRCPVVAVKTYLTKQNKQCQALWQKPKNHKAMKLSPAEDVWYCNALPGMHRLENLLCEMSKKAGLATIYTSHCLRANSVTFLKASRLENVRAKSVTGHKSNSAIESFHKRPTLEQQVQSSAIVSNFVAGSMQCHVSKERALIEIQQNQLMEQSGSQVQTTSTSSRVTSSWYMVHSVNPSVQSFLAGQFHNRIFNRKCCSN